MNEFRKNLITNDWVMFAPSRASRPIELKGTEKTNQLDEMLSRDEHKDDCPFCDDSDKAREVYITTFKNKKDKEIVRVLPNKYASLNRDIEPVKSFHHMHNHMQGFGIHDVIIDNPLHNKTIALISLEELSILINAYKQRYIEIQKMNHIRHVVVFKNQGYKAGGSLEHPHSQIYGLPVIPFQLRVRLTEMKKYYESHCKCMMCDMIQAEKQDKIRVLHENNSFISFIPYAALSPYHVWIVPKNHQASFTLIENKQIEDFAEIMQKTFSMAFFALENLDFNFIIQSLTEYKDSEEFFHWYMSIIYHQKRRGGIEFAGGLFVNPLMPEKAAEHLLENKDKSLEDI
jgi:UDPglucose--hexose-1-phosphate uridylyltransferase